MQRWKYLKSRKKEKKAKEIHTVGFWPKSLLTNYITRLFGLHRISPKWFDCLNAFLVLQFNLLIWISLAGYDCSRVWGSCVVMPKILKYVSSVHSPASSYYCYIWGLAYLIFCYKYLIIKGYKGKIMYIRFYYTLVYINQILVFFWSFA